MCTSQYECEPVDTSHVHIRPPSVIISWLFTCSGGPLPEELLPQVTCPVRILWGENDPWEPISLGRAYGDFDCVDEFVPLIGKIRCLLLFSSTPCFGKAETTAANSNKMNKVCSRKTCSSRTSQVLFMQSTGLSPTNHDYLISHLPGHTNHDLYSCRGRALSHGSDTRHCQCWVTSIPRLTQINPKINRCYYDHVYCHICQHSEGIDQVVTDYFSSVLRK